MVKLFIMATFNYPAKAAYGLARDMRLFLAKTEDHAPTGLNQYADQDRREVVRQIDWEAFNKVIEQLEFTYLSQKKYGRK